MFADWSDEDLLAAFVNGEHEALAILAQRYERPMLGFAYGLLGKRDPAAAEEAVQDAWIGVLRGARGFQARSRFKTWAYRILINCCMQQSRGKPKPQSLVDGQEPRDRAKPHLDALANTEWHERLRTLVSALPARRRALVLLCFHHELSREQAAEILGMPLGTVKSQLHATLRELRTQLETERIG